MKKKRLQLGLIFFTGIAAAFYAGWPSHAQREKAADIAGRSALLNDYCVSCHNQKSKTAGVVLEGLDFNRVGKDADLWEKVLRKLRTGQMPPANAPKPEAEESSAFVAWLESR